METMTKELTKLRHAGMPAVEEVGDRIAAGFELAGERLIYGTHPEDGELGFPLRWAATHAAQRAVALIDYRDQVLEELRSEDRLKPEAFADEVGQRVRAKAEREAEIGKSKEVLDRAATRVEKLKREITLPEPGESEQQFGAEIRAHFKALSVEERGQVLDRAAREGDLSTLAPVLRGPAFLSGIEPETQERLRNRLLTELHGEKIEELERLGLALDSALRVYNGARQAIERVSRG